MPKVVPEYKEQAKQTIIMAAARTFIEKGYYQTKMDDIAKSIGVSKGAIYRYFKSKKQLLFEVIEFILNSRKDEMMNIISSGDFMSIATGEFFEMKIIRFLQTQSSGQDLFIEAARNEKLRERMTDIYEKSFTEFLTHVENLKDQGVIKREADVGVVWKGLVALRDGLMNSILTGTKTSDAKKTWETVSSLLLKEILTDST